MTSEFIRQYLIPKGVSPIARTHFVNNAVDDAMAAAVVLGCKIAGAESYDFSGTFTVVNWIGEPIADFDLLKVTLGVNG